MSFSYDIKVFPIANPSGKVVAFANLIVEGVMEVNGFRVVDGSRGLFVSAPQTKGKNKEGEDTWYNDVRWLEDKDEGEFKGPFETEVYAAIVAAYEQGQTQGSRAGAAKANTNAGAPSGKRPNSAKEALGGQKMW